MRCAYPPYKTNTPLSRKCRSRRVDKRSTSTNRTAHCQHQRNEQHAPVAAQEIEVEAEEVHFLNHLKPWFINYCKAPSHQCTVNFKFCSHDYCPVARLVTCKRCLEISYRMFHPVWCQSIRICNAP